MYNKLLLTFIIYLHEDTYYKSVIHFYFDNSMYLHTSPPDLIGNSVIILFQSLEY